MKSTLIHEFNKGTSIFWIKKIDVEVTRTILGTNSKFDKNKCTKANLKPL